MTARPHLDISSPGGEPSALAVVLHGGRSASHRAVHSQQLAVLRMVPFAAALRSSGAAGGLVVVRLRYAVRGWNGCEHSPVSDVEWALDELARRFPGLPAALVGHSMGGRAAMYAAGHETVRAVVGLAPWIEPGDPVAPLAGRRVLVAHGDRDRTTSADCSAAYVRRAASIAQSASYVSVTAEKHAMLRRAAVWHHLAAGFVTGVLYDRAPPADRADPNKILTQALAGQASLVV